jgi:hypothetical protein
MLMLKDNWFCITSSKFSFSFLLAFPFSVSILTNNCYSSSLIFFSYSAIYALLLYFICFIYSSINSNLSLLIYYSLSWVCFISFFFSFKKFITSSFCYIYSLLSYSNCVISSIWAYFKSFFIYSYCCFDLSNSDCYYF